MSNLDYTYAVARIRALETKLVSAGLLGQLASADAPSIISSLGDLGLNKFLRDAKTVDQFEFGLNHEIEYTFDLLATISPENKIIVPFKMIYDFENIKIILKKVLTNTPYKEGSIASLGTVSFKKLEQAIESKVYWDISEPLKTAIHNAKAAWAKYEHNVTFIDLSVEKTMWSCLLKLTEDLHLPFIAKFFRIYIDISNIRTFLRVKLFSRDRAFLLEGIVDGGNIDRDFYIGLYAEQIETFLNNLTNTNYEKLVNDGLYELPANKSLALFEKAIDEYIIDWFRPTKYMAFGMEPLIAYLFYKQIEVKNLRHVVLSKIAGLNADEISLYLRMM